MAAINSDFWSLPNPSAFLKRIVDNSIIDGISTIIRFPKTFRKDFYDAIENSFQSIDVKFFSVNSKDALVLDSPLTYLLKTYGKSVNRRNLPSMGSLSKVETLKNSVIFLRELMINAGQSGAVFWIHTRFSVIPCLLMEEQNSWYHSSVVLILSKERYVLEQ